MGQPGPARADFARDYPGFVLPEAMPEGGWWNRPYSTILPYRVGDRLLVLGLTPPPQPADADPADAAAAVAAGPVAFTVTEQRPGRRRRRIGSLALESVRAGDAAFSFDPVLNHPPGLRPDPLEPAIGYTSTPREYGGAIR